MIVIGIVGLISSGKTTVCETISQNGFKVINLDILSHQVYRSGSSAYKEIINTWGKDVLDDQKQISRASLAEKVFVKGDNEISKLEKPGYSRRSYINKTEMKPNCFLLR